MNAKIISYLNIGLKVTTILSGLSAYAGYIPEKYAVPAALVFMVISTTKDFITHLITDFTQPDSPDTKP